MASVFLLDIYFHHWVMMFSLQRSLHKSEEKLECIEESKLHFPFKMLSSLEDELVDYLHVSGIRKICVPLQASDR